MNKLVLPLLIFALTGCAVKNEKDPALITSIQLINRNGLTETISQKDRLKPYQTLDFLHPQPYQKILRIYGRGLEGSIKSKITAYHPNGQIWQYLDVVDGRAKGVYREWHSNGQLKLEVTVIEGMADLNELAQMSWLFDGTSLVWDERGREIAKIVYERGELQGDSLYYYPDGKISKIIPYQKGVIGGTLRIFDEQGFELERLEYQKGEKNGICSGFWKDETVQYKEEYVEGLLQTAHYFSPQGELLGEIKKGEGVQCHFNQGRLYSRVEIQNGLPEGRVDIFNAEGKITRSYRQKERKKHGEEWQYFPSSSQPKLQLFWQNDFIQGIAKTWYENGNLESQREMHNNKKHGHNFAWYKEGDLMLSENYENDRLVKGSYFKKGDKSPVSRVEEGKGIATLFDSEGHFLQRVRYARGEPEID